MGTCTIHPKETRMYYSKINKNYICWSCYRERFIRKRNLRSLEIFEPKLISLGIFRQEQNKILVADTLRKNGKWESKIKFEQLLIDLELDYFTYIKFYRVSELISRPLVVGETGSLNVNLSGSDISFSKDVKHGPARIFLKEGNFDWDDSKLLIIKAQSKNQAKFFEHRISETFGLFNS